MARDFTTEEAQKVADQIGLDTKDFDIEQFRMGLKVELEHGKWMARTNVTGDDYELTGKIAWAHLIEIPDYYTRLEAMEEQAKKEGMFFGED